jgi:hypothetical protein
MTINWVGGEAAAAAAAACVICHIVKSATWKYFFAQSTSILLWNPISQMWAAVEARLVIVGCFSFIAPCSGVSLSGGEGILLLQLPASGAQWNLLLSTRTSGTPGLS